MLQLKIKSCCRPSNDGGHNDDLKDSNTTVEGFISKKIKMTRRSPERSNFDHKQQRQTCFLSFFLRESSFLIAATGQKQIFNLARIIFSSHTSSAPMLTNFLSISTCKGLFYFFSPLAHKLIYFSFHSLPIFRTSKSLQFLFLL